ncbi:hypothetical protein AW736_07870 [Termitidicoccus mucosus]|uniref:Uncharacterized protein n=1 Tax=Termitidicoccus mucosus TaxID=1184151 RepID=A0A178IMT9_9BACT|nr:hypothetical protein AW736_07870 [Opitutaceae bacterium TSB47]
MQSKAVGWHAFFTVKIVVRHAQEVLSLCPKDEAQRVDHRRFSGIVFSDQNGQATFDFQPQVCPGGLRAKEAEIFCDERN